jgi:transposase-like protein
MAQTSYLSEEDFNEVKEKVKALFSLEEEIERHKAAIKDLNKSYKDTVEDVARIFDVKAKIIYDGLKEFKRVIKEKETLQERDTFVATLLEVLKIQEEL